MSFAGAKVNEILAEPPFGLENILISFEV